MFPYFTIKLGIHKNSYGNVTNHKLHLSTQTHF